MEVHSLLQSVAGACDRLSESVVFDDTDMTAGRHSLK